MTISSKTILLTSENKFLHNKNALICCFDEEEYCKLDKIYKEELEYIKNNFAGEVFDDLKVKNFSTDILIYLCGNIDKICEVFNFAKRENIFIIDKLSYNYNADSFRISLGQVPINVCNVGVFFRNFFDSPYEHNISYFEKINNEHKFQLLTESNKSNNAFRNGIYLTQVTEDKEKDETYFNLLRCSTNLNGPTENFREIDNNITNKVNYIAQYFFEQKTNLNHVLAQIYNNLHISKNVEKKAKIKEHSDKTKDMPRNGLMAFCTFYKDFFINEFSEKELESKTFKKTNDDLFDYRINNRESVLTKLRWRKKKTISDTNLVNQFDVLLYPNSVFITSLETNRLYTHEIVPSNLPIDKLPTRMGYVIRCSKTKAVHKAGQTFIKDNETLIPLIPPSQNIEGVHQLKQLYLLENTSTQLIDYDIFNFSLNLGDYLKATT